MLCPLHSWVYKSVWLLLCITLYETSISDLTWFVFVDEKWDGWCLVLTKVSQECNPGLSTFLRCNKQNVLLLKIKDENSLRYIDKTEDKSFSIHVIRVARNNVISLGFLTDSSSSATKLRRYKQIYQLKTCHIFRCMICYLSCYVKDVKLAETKVFAMGFHELHDQLFPTSILAISWAMFFIVVSMNEIIRDKMLWI